MEIWDGYNADGTLAGVDLIRGEEIPKGLYHLVCEILVRHVDGDYLLMQRDFNKEGYPGFFEATAGGSALKGEDKLACAKRELFEETGIASEDFEEIGHSMQHEAAFLCVHSVLHLLGYDHELGEDEEKLMFDKQKQIIEKISEELKEFDK